MFTPYSEVRAKNTLVLQQGQSDCGLSSLASIINYHGGKPSLEKLRELSGTTAQSTTMLGLYQAAQQVGLSAEGLEAEHVRELKAIEEPVILQLTTHNRLHYVVMYGIDPETGNAVIGDPARGIVYSTLEELDNVWPSKALLRLIPVETFVRSSADNERRRKWLLDLVKGEASFLRMAFALAGIFAISGASILIVAQQFIDNIVPSGNTQNFVIGIMLLTLLLGVKGSIAYLKMLFITRQGKDFTYRLVEKLYNNLMYLPKTFFDLRKAGELTARMNDTTRIQSKVSLLFGNMMDDLFVVVAFSVAAFLYSPLLTLIVATSIPLYVLLTYAFNDNVIRSQRKLIGSAVTLESLFIETAESMDTIKALNRESFFETLYKQTFGFFQTKIFHIGKLSARFTFFADLLNAVFIMIAFVFCSWSWKNGNLHGGEAIVLFILITTIIVSTNRLAIANTQFQEVRIAFNRIYDFMIIKPENFNDPVAAMQDRFSFEEDFRLKIKNLSFRFPGRKQLLRGISLRVKAGEVIGLTGGSGTGKSTLVQILQKLYKPESGKIEVNSIDLEKIPTAQWRKIVGVVPQQVKIFNNNLLYNLTLSENPDDVDAAIEFCQYYGFDQYFEAFPQGYLTPLGDNGTNISNAQRQLVGLARTLFLKPKLLIFDDCLTSIDSRMERFVLSLLTKLRSTTAIIVVMNRLKFSQHADRIYILQNNELIASGSHDELMLTANYYSDSLRQSG